VFRELYMQWHARVYYYFYNKVHSSDEAKELVQLTFIKIWNSRSTLTTAYPFEVQLFKVASSVLIDSFRQKARKKNQVSPLNELAERSGPSNPAQTFEVNDQLEAVMHQLPPMRRKVFELYKVQGYSYKEIAEMLAISVKTVDNHVAQAVKQLKTLLSALALLFFLS